MDEHVIVVHMNNSNLDESVLTARAASYLGYADTTRTLAYLGEIVDAKAYQNRDNGETQVYVTYEIPLLSPNDERLFKDEMDRLSRVVQHIHRNKNTIAQR